ncbi:ABC transporter permease [Alicyclobacillus tolerans]|uniref:ABC transporter permease n=1 Tax=Alicyclobacillus tolerans TaxID=90970 RepID=UPI001F248ABE|nr:ABC transporter permease [Alicyclobacillus tolerans]MCF8564973.1 ABC transporter permease [Alicyclobacillus tolerans]
MILSEMLWTAWASLRANKLRTFLTMLGILIGVGSIIAIIAIGQGGQAAILSTLESSRAQRTIQILPTELVAPGLPQPGQVLDISSSDLQLARQFSGVASVDYTLFGQAYTSAGTKTVNASIQAGPSYLDEIGHFVVIQGRMFTNADVIAHRKVVLLSQPLEAKLFGNLNPIGKTIQIQGQPLQVIGVTASTQLNLLQGVFGSDYLYMPATTCLDIFPYWNITEMDVEVQSGADKAALAKRLVLALNIHAHNSNAFEDSSRFLLGIEKTVGTVTSILTLVIGAVAGIALIVGGVGVMNIMLVSVTERTQEIGIRMSLGATRRAILLQFLTESVFITALGGVLGVMLGAAAAFAIHAFTPLPAVISWWAVLGSFLFSALIGVLCGIYPANKAARLNPIEALRYE